MSNANSYIGVDLHKKTCFITVMNQAGKIKKQMEISTDTDKVAKFFAKHTEASVAVESTMNWIPFYENLESLGCSVVCPIPWPPRPSPQPESRMTKLILGCWPTS